VLGVGKVAKYSEEDGKRKRGSRPSLEDSAVGFKENLKRLVKRYRERQTNKTLQETLETLKRIPTSREDRIKTRERIYTATTLKNL